MLTDTPEITRMEEEGRLKNMKLNPKVLNQ